MALAPLYDYVRAIYAMLPRGSIWPVEPGDAPDFDALIDATSHEFARVHQNGEDFLDDFLPDTSTSLLPRWESLLGLVAGSLTDAQRRAQIIAQLRRRSDPTRANLQAIADSWGLGATVYDHAYELFLMGQGQMGDPLHGEVWIYTVLVVYPGPGNAAFEDTIRASVPAHVLVVFEYT